MNIILIFFSIKYKGDWDKIYQALENKEKVTLKEGPSLQKTSSILYIEILMRFDK